MSKLQAISPPIWIFAFTLLLIIVTGGMMGGDSCDSAVADCETVSVEGASAGAVACSEEACSGGRTAALPLSIIALGFVVYFVWLRQGGLEGDTLFTGEAHDASGDSGDDAKAPSPPAKKSAPAARSAPAAPAPPEAPPSKAAPVAGSAVPPARLKLYVGLLGAEAAESKETLAEGLARLIGNTEAKSWKEAPLGDLELLTKSLALAALLSAGDPAYSESSGAAADAVHASLTEKTKKALHEHCVETIRRDVKRLTKGASYPEGVTAKTARDITDALAAPDALSGLARCSKGALVELAAFLEPR